jgi:hypothetical protein
VTDDVVNDEVRAMDNPSVSAIYCIRLAGHLDPHWSAWFDGLVIGHEPDGVTSLTGTVRDQAALYGLLSRVRDLGLTLLSVERLMQAAQDSPPSESL